MNIQPEHKIKPYVGIDKQSNHSLAKAKPLNILDLEGEATPYMLKTCSGTSQVQERRAHNLVVESRDNAFSYALPALTECHAIPDIREEIPTLSVARAHPHLQSWPKILGRFAKFITNCSHSPPPPCNVDTMLCLSTVRMIPVALNIVWGEGDFITIAKAA